ncbi:MAG: 2-C-methyl-D-erythritol 2,4-cyclodiphosphate synthase [Candidatus Acidiferrales bacterium]
MSELTRSGIGYDLHHLAEGRKLIIGGIELPFEKGPVGHSDGDVLSHCICDALLGASGLGDIGTHFPDTDPKWNGVSSLLFLEHTRKLLNARGHFIVYVDAIVVTEKPKLGPHFPAMRAALALALGIAPEQINLKAKTNEGVDAIGRGEALAAYAVATIGGGVKPTANARGRTRQIKKKPSRKGRPSSRPRKRP